MERLAVRRVARWTGLAVAVYLGLAYLVAPGLWRHYEHLPALASTPTITTTSDRHPGDPLNVALVGSEGDVQRAFAAAGWHPADPITLRSSLAIAESVVLRRPDPDAPVSNLYLFGRPQDLAFELEVGDSARERNHVRWWRTDLRAHGDRPVWTGSATFDRAPASATRRGRSPITSRPTSTPNATG